MTDLRAQPLGDAALLIHCRAEQTLAVAERARARWPQALDVVPGADTVLVDGVADPTGSASEVGAWTLDSGETRGAASGRIVELETRYDGPDLEHVAALWGLAPAEAVELHASQLYVVAFCGFAPGFAYCTGLPERWAVPRRQSPRSRIEPGSVALADIYTGVYPTASPGGWQVIGRTAASLWDLGRDEPALLAPGTTVRFTAQ